jgi:predicted  nucleic acid-binding Zn-ribbon protein
MVASSQETRTMRRTAAVPLAGLALAGAFSAAVSTHAQEPLPSSAELLRELAAIRASLEKLSSHIEALTRQQELDVLVRRIEVKQDRLIPIEAELREARNEGKRLASETEKLDLLETQWRDELVKRRTIDGDGSTDETERQLVMLRQRKETLETQAAANQQRILELENRFDDTRRDIEAVEMLVDERLKLR